MHIYLITFFTVYFFRLFKSVGAVFNNPLTLNVTHTATGKDGSTGTETGTVITKRCGEPEPVLWPYSLQVSQISSTALGTFFNSPIYTST